MKEKTINKLKNIHWLAETIILAIVTLIGTIWFAFSQYQRLNDINEEILMNLKTTQQMSLKSVIWNDNIPLTERASACDVYLSAGYNSLTKKECELIIEKESQHGSLFK